MNGWSRNTVYLAVGLTAAGFVLIVLGWNGAAGKDTIPQQFPYIISGGLAGVALVVAGMTLALVQELRRHHAEQLRKVDELIEAVAAGAGQAGGPTAVPEGGGVVAGRTTYHLPDCHLVEGRDDLQVMSPQDARDRGLAPCRICEPQEATA